MRTFKSLIHTYLQDVIQQKNVRFDVDHYLEQKFEILTQKWPAAFFKTR